MNLLTRFGVLLLWLLHFLPNALIIRLGRSLGHLLWPLMAMRRRITLTNLRLCFPEMSEAEREALAREHFALYGRTLFERVILWWGSAERIRNMAQLSGLEHLDQAGDRPVILFSFHFVGMDVGWTRLTLERTAAGMYANGGNPVMDQLIHDKRNRFGHSVAVSSKLGLRGALKVMLEGKPLMYLPDMDFGRKHSIFVPFFGVTAATIPNLSRMAGSTQALVIPLVPRLTSEGWQISIEPPWEDFPSADAAADTRRMNAYIESWVRRYPAQYWWTHKRFKTRPEGEKSVY